MSKAHEVTNHHGTSYRRFKCTKCKWWHLEVINSVGTLLFCYINGRDKTFTMCVGPADGDNPEHIGKAKLMGEVPAPPINFLIRAYHGLLQAFYAVASGCIEPNEDVSSIPFEQAAATILGHKRPTRH